MEIWKGVTGYEDLYEVSNLGNVKSLNYNKENRCKNLVPINSEGYLRIKIKRKAHSIHRLVAIHFIPNIENKPCVNHINGIKTDNRVENLEWCTPLENQLHAIRTGLKIQKKGEEHGGSKLKESDILRIRQMKCKIAEIAECYGVSRRLIAKIQKRELWSHI